ncbi:UbiA family prenyltransferase [Desertivirga brevis]|uniref:UbiA family prenyltransferase n=1 Tax=Desertivirga brevis TaxID=2810310 RepID=UPI001A96C4B0|nr:UbiA family prenyltransferase [Pedobacter sp. SYSU D00873]
MPILPSKSALLHMRFLFSFFLLPVFVFALSQAVTVRPFSAILVFIAWHLFVYPASNGYNSYFDKDEGSIALLEKPPAVDKSLYWFSLLFDLIGFVLGLLVSLEFAFCTVLYGLLSKMYSHPSVRLKKNPVTSFLVVFIFQGAFVYWASLAALSGTSIAEMWSKEVLIGGLICSCLIGASYPLTQVYQHEEDTRRGDRTLSLLLGIRGSFMFSGMLFLVGVILVFFYWEFRGSIANFWLFLLFTLPVGYVFFSWFAKVFKDKTNANFKYMSRMTLTSGASMLLYFLTVYFRSFLNI